MKIFYAVQATGNGHISRAVQLLPYLQKFGEVDIFLSGSNSNMDSELPVKYRSSGISLFYNKNGSLSYTKSFFKNNYWKCLKDIKNLPVEKYDVVINDFEFITSKACALKKVPSIQMSHQASFTSKKTPRPLKKDMLSELVLKYYANASQYLGFHFQKYDDFITPPVIKDNILQATPTDKGHVTVYLPSLSEEIGLKIFQRHPDIQFHWFYGGCKEERQERNVIMKPISNDGFTKSMIDAHGILTGGGFETPAEAMYLGKKIMCIPVKGHYEQMSNAIAAERLGAVVLEDISSHSFSEKLEKWMNSSTPAYNIEANNINLTLEEMFDNYPKK